MARLFNSPLGEIRGKVGNFIYRKVNGKIYVSSCPIKSASSKRKYDDPAAIIRKKRFALTAKLAKSINNIPDLKYLWKKTTYNKMSSGNAIIRANYPFVSDKTVVYTPRLAPEAMELNEEGIELSFDCNEILIKYSAKTFRFPDHYYYDKFIKVVGIIHSVSPHSEHEEPFSFKSVSSCNYSLSKEEDINMSILLDESTINILKEYANHKLYYAFITSNEDFVPQKAVATFTHELKGLPE